MFTSVFPLTEFIFFRKTNSETTDNPFEQANSVFSRLKHDIYIILRGFNLSVEWHNLGSLYAKTCEQYGVPTVSIGGAVKYYSHKSLRRGGKFGTLGKLGGQYHM